MPDRERQNVMLMASLRAGVFETRVRVADISKGGVKLRSAACVPPGAEVQIELPGLGWVAAIVAWTRADTFGLRFHTEIDPGAARQAVTGAYITPPPPAQLRRVA